MRTYRYIATLLTLVASSLFPLCGLSSEMLEITYFTANRHVTNRESPVTLFWKVTGAVSVEVSGLGPVNAEGRYTILATRSISFTLRARSKTGQTKQKDIFIEVPGTLPYEPIDYSGHRGIEQCTGCQEVTVSYSTNRHIQKITESWTYYGDANDDKNNFGRVVVSVPPSHQRGGLEKPEKILWVFKLDDDPNEHFVIQRVASEEKDQFLKRIAREGATSRSVLIYVHGYNVSFNFAAKRAAQLKVDIPFPGATMFFSWPSQDRFVSYLKDGTLAQQSVPVFEELIRHISEGNIFDSIYIVAHSMGARIVTRALANMADRKEIPIKEVILAAADIDAKVFLDQIAPRFVRSADRITMYMSAHDKALKTSQQINGFPRVGDSGDIVIYDRMDSIDATMVGANFSGHSYYGDNPKLLADIKSVLLGVEANERNGLVATGSADEGFWRCCR